MSLVEFEEWFDDEYSNYGKSYKERYDERNDMYSSQFVDERYDAFKAGQQSQQGEVNKLQTKIDAITKQRDSFIKAHHIAMNDVCENKAKIDELQKLRSLDEMAINQLAQANQVWRTKCDELQERIEEVLIEMKNQLGDEDYYGMERPNYDAMLYALRNIKDILKGNKDEN